LTNYFTYINNESYSLLFVKGGTHLEKENTLQQLRANEKEVRKQLILEATLALFGEKQISEVSMRDIAKEAGISASLIYRHFKDRDELFIEAFILKSQEMIATFECVILDKDIILIEDIGKEFVNYLIHNPLFFKMMSYFMLDHTLVADHLERFNTTIRELLEIFDTGFKQNGVKEDIRLHSHAFFSALNGIMITFYHYPGRSESEVEQHIEKLTTLISSLFTKSE